jgi:hypothetical protein
MAAASQAGRVVGSVLDKAGGSSTRDVHFESGQGGRPKTEGAKKRKERMYKQTDVVDGDLHHE